MAYNTMLTDIEKTKFDNMDEKARILIWSGSQEILSSGTYNFYSTLKFPVSSALYVKFSIEGIESVSENDFTDVIRTELYSYASGNLVSIQSALTSLTIRNDSAISLKVQAIFMYLN